MTNPLDLHIEKMRPQIALLESGLELPIGFFESLRAENDWSFVIKFHAVFEAALVQALTGHLGKDCLAEIFGYLDTSNGRTGKIAFARALGLLEQEECKYIVVLSVLRNNLVHKVRNVGFSFDEYFRGMNPDQLNKFVAEFSKEPVPKPETSKWKSYREGFVKFPKDMIWFIGMYILFPMFAKRQLAITRREMDRAIHELSIKHISSKKRAPVLAELLGSGFVKAGWWPFIDEYFNPRTEAKADKDSPEHPSR